MKKKLFIAASLLFAIGITQVSAQKNKKDASKATTQAVINTANDTISYAYGASLAQQGLQQYLKQLGITEDQEKLNLFLKGLNESLPEKGKNTPYITGLAVGDQTFNMATEFSKRAFADKSVDNLNLKLIAEGLSDALSGKKFMVDSVDAVIDKIMKEADIRNQEIKMQENAPLIEKSKRFMEENKTKDGVVTLPSGLQYKIVTKGNGEIPTANDKVTVHYKGTLLDGTEFDNSYNRGEPLTLGVGQVIKGWTEALQLMPVGSKWILYIPYDLAYGDRSTGPIPAYSNLIFEIDLISIEK